MPTSTHSTMRQTACGLTYWDNGEQQGDVYVLLHGISSGAGLWAKQFASQTGKNRLIAWDAPGYGDSVALASATPTAADYAHALKAVVDEAGLTAFTLVGHSLGALMASAYASLYPADVSRLVLASVAQGYGQTEPEQQQQVYEKRPRLLAELGPEAMARERGPFLLGQATAENMLLVTQAMKRLTLAGFKASSYVLAHDSIDYYLPAIQGAIEVLYGTEDGITPPAGMQALQQHYVQMNLQAVPQAGHLLYVDQPALFDRLVFEQTQPGKRENNT
ncbi:3-oxoadipate enol-lactonase [Alcaligenes pakistanensis]|uniref:3-oxoadipate enol-lactonase n=1 Tax=Alcaligenes pakistanensis TaxID=1482717 RepID=A0A8H9IK04_9BURK|nr:alpha/beta hydrolase [Alcaligenes pakistanensis]GHC57550.1 3-oxoadipate enol-lactonase [Alcaligenes pakistanensis]